MIPEEGFLRERSADQSQIGPDTMYSAVLFVLLAVNTRHLQVIAQGCRSSSGKEVKEGGAVETSDPCLECSCARGKLQCRLKVCPRLPRPPPESCILLQRPNTCCDKLLCPDGTKNNVKARSNLESKLSERTGVSGCIFNGTLYAEGSAMTSSLCEYCYCIKGKQHCVRPQCTLSVPGCSPEYAKHSCCPTKYNCSDASNMTTSTTVSPTSTPSYIGCHVEGVKYPEGERLLKMEKNCENCFCMQGRVRCEPVVCSMPPLSHCRPIISKGHCCPTSYNCSPEEETESSVTKESQFETTTFVTEENFTTYFPESTTPFVTTTFDDTTMTEVGNDTELRSGGYDDQYVDADATTTEYFLSTTSPSQITTMKLNSSASPTVRAIPAVLEAIINRTLERDGDYDEYDYNEPSLPPSLPNLKIIPFVAADAVVTGDEGSEPFEHDDGKLRTTQGPLFFEVPQNSKFSPPAETEGGFLPRDPMIDGPFYESKFEGPFVGSSNVQSEHTSETNLPLITEPPKLFEEGRCKTKGTTYHHGEVVSEPKACELCVCYFGKVHCQKAKCSDKSQCHKDSCCQCDDGLEEPLKSEVTPPTYIPESLSNLPAITVADVIVTPDPFKDVIRTEPAPDLVHIMKDMIPHFEKPTAVNFSTPRPNATSTTEATTTEKSKDYDYDNISFSSVLELLFNGSPEGSKAETTTQKPSTNSVYDSQDSDSPEFNLVLHADERADHFKNNSIDSPEEKADSNEPSSDFTKGLLKLAGCNIYGRMYRVGKIIAELSNPCLECMCTELGVQCKKLKC
ncbi:uncharacterized protein LOC106664958 isoform X2 [Cimex lectularius]|uniref:VWFC domain-containing protein n=1 Tax=Cimex lectularius TaxID=79782 RepID=A0A8I6SKH9_CIMLE|nr:uncharacterized protein LOC106664958 isoform X2 [Cimex lectularius]